MAETISKFILFFLLIFTPLAFGTVEPWAYGIMEILAAAGMLSFCISLFRQETDLYEIPGFSILVIFLGYILLQLLPVPCGVVELISPRAFFIQKEAFELTGHTGWMTLSLNHEATTGEFFRYGTYAIVYILTVQILTKKRHIQTLMLMIALFGGSLAFSSILQFYLTTDMALWFRHSPNNSIIMGPYINHNHYAGLMEMVFPVVLALFFFYKPRRTSQGSFIQGIVEILNQEKANIHILIGTSALLILVSIFVSLSRGAMISISIAMLLFSILLLKQRINKGNTTLMIGLVIAAALAVSWFGWDQILDRFARMKNDYGLIHDVRMDFWKDILQYIKDYPLTGSGMGTFVHVYPNYKSLIDSFTLTHAHNDYLELLAEGGIVGFFLAGAFLFTLLKKTYPVFLDRRDAFSIYIYMGSLTSMLSILLHSITDFNLHIGANGLWFFFLAGLVVSSAHTNIHRKNVLTRLQKNPFGFRKSLFIFSTSLFAATLFLYNIFGTLSFMYFNKMEGAEINRQTPLSILEKIVETSDKTIRFNPCHAEAYYLKANAAWLAGDKNTATKSFGTAIRLSPLNPRYLKRFGTLLAIDDLSQADAGTAFRLSAGYAPTMAEYTFRYGSWLLAAGHRELGLEWLQKTLKIDGRFSDKVISAMLFKQIGLEEMKAAFPDSPNPLLSFAKFLYTIGRQKQAVQLHIDALSLIKKETKGAVWLFIRIHRFFMRHGDLKNAEQAMLLAEEMFPDNGRIQLLMGEFYEKQGILYKARDKYEQALFLDPKNKHILKQINRLNKQTNDE